MDFDLAILAGGKATRLYPVTETIPKSMVRLCGEPFIVHQLRLLQSKGIKKVVLCLGTLAHQVEEFVRDGKDFSLNVKYSYDGDKLLGTGGALKNALPLLSDSFFFMYGDSYLDIDFEPIEYHFKGFDKQGLITVLKNNNQWDKSNIEFKNGQVLNYSKNDNNPALEYIDYGLGILNKKCFESFEKNDAFDLTELYLKLLKGNELLGYEVFNRFYEIGSFNGLKETESYIFSHSKLK